MYEPNVELRDQAGYGRAGTYEIGQWGQIYQSNPFVSMALDHILRPIADARVDISPAKSSGLDEATATMHADFVRWALTEHFQLSRLSKVAAQGFLLSGFALFEPLAELVPYQASPAEQAKTDQRLEKGEITTRLPTEVWAIRDCPQRLPNSLDPSSPWHIDDEGRLTGVAQMGPKGMSGKWVRTVLEVDRALLFSWKREAGNFAGQSQLRTCWYLAAKPMPMLSKMIGVTLQREGPGIPQAISTSEKAKPLTPEQREELIELYADMSAHESSGMVMPMGWKTEWTFSPISNKGHLLDVYERMGMYILQQFGAQQLALGVNGTGSRSVGEVHDARSMAMVKEVLGFLADGYNGARGEADGLVKKLVDWNFGPQPAYPRLQLVPQRPELGPKEMAEAIGAAKNAGLVTPTLKDQNAFRERASLPRLTQEEFDVISGAGTTTALNGAQVTAAKELMQSVVDGALPYEAVLESLVTFFNITAERAEKLMGALKTFKPEPKEEPAAPGAPVLAKEEPPALAASAVRGVWAPWRPLRASEEKLKLEGINTFLSTSRDRFDSIIRAEAVGMLGMAGPTLERAMADGKVTPAEVASLPLETARLKTALAKYLASVRATGAAFVREELAQTPLIAASEEDEVTAIAEADAVVEATTTAIVRRIENRVRAEVEREAIDTMRTGGAAQEVLNRTIRRQLETGAFKSDAGSVTTKVFNVGREEAARLIGGVGSVEYSAVLDSATCSPCQSMDGRTAEFDSAEHDAMLPPNRDCAGGDACRCLLIFVPSRGDE